MYIPHHLCFLPDSPTNVGEHEQFTNGREARGACADIYFRFTCVFCAIWKRRGFRGLLFYFPTSICKSRYFSFWISSRPAKTRKMQFDIRKWVAVFCHLIHTQNRVLSLRHLCWSVVDVSSVKYTASRGVCMVCVHTCLDYRGLNTLLCIALPYSTQSDNMPQSTGAF